MTVEKRFPVLAASILDADYSNLRYEIESVEQAGVDLFTLDVMDGTFVSRITFGDYVVARVREWTNLAIDVHLMVDRPETYVRRMYDAGADIITFHLEAAERPRETIQEIRSYGLLVGIALNVDTSIELATQLLDLVDLVNLMAVPTGFGGQSLNPSIFDRVDSLRREIEVRNLSVAVEVDGGVKIDNVAALAKVGAQVLTVGTGIYHATKRTRAVAELKREIHLGSPHPLDLDMGPLLIARNTAQARSNDQLARLRQLRDSLDISPDKWEL